MAMIKINIDGRELKGHDGQTILNVALENGIDIPTLCHDERVKTYGACGVCVVEIENSPKLVRACSTAIAPNMVVKTNTTKVRSSRQTALELLLSDHTGDCRPPCLTACPGNTDCQGYVGLIANGQYEEALELIKDKIPLPSSIGRVCPHPCEDACRRQLVEEPISIAQLKMFAGDYELKAAETFMPEIKPSIGKSVAIIGGGPGGLTAAYFLKRAGVDVTIYDAMPKMGGMLRYGIPEYRLPKAVLDKEIKLITDMGIQTLNNIKIGRDLNLAYLNSTYDAVVVAIGAWTSTKLNCPGEDLEGVIGGINFLQNVALNNTVLTGKRVAVVGGGNTAMDSVRTAVRLGAKEVYNIYRRTKAEMPAEEIEIVEAEEEGVIFKNLTNPIEVVGENGKVTKIRLQKMELGEPDASGRRAPVAIKGAEETISLDCVIVAIGQATEPSGFEILDKTRWNTISADQNTYRTNIDGVFAIGDATNKGASIAIEAIGDAKRAAQVILSYLLGETIPYKEPYIVTTDPSPEKFADRQKITREKMNHLKPDERKDNFNEVVFGYTEEQAKKEASRCLECGCADYFECKLIDYANQYDVKPEKYTGKVHSREAELTKPETSHPFIHINPDKCVLCGLCVRICDEVMGRTALGLVDRGFDTIVKPELGLPLAHTDCISCGQCVMVCPTGALIEKLKVEKPVPVKETYTESVCSFCSVGCKTKVGSKNDLILRALPNDTDNKEALLCVKGRFGTAMEQNYTRITKPFIRKNGKLVQVSFEEAAMYVAKKAQSLSALKGSNTLAVAISDKYTNEEIFMIKEYATEVLKTENVFSFNGSNSGVKEVLGLDASTVSLESMENTEVILLMSEDIMNTHTIAGIRIKRAVENGAKLILLSRKTTQADEWASIKIKPSDQLDTLKQFAKAIIDSGKTCNAENFEILKDYLKDVTPSVEIKNAAQVYANAKNAVIVLNQKELTTDATRLLADIAVIAGQTGKARSGLIQLKPNNNSQGLVDMGVELDHKKVMYSIQNKTITGLLIFGEDIPEFDISNLKFVMVMDSILTETAEKADVVFPASIFAETKGSYTSTDSVTRAVTIIRPSLIGYENWELVKKLANSSNDNITYETVEDIQKAIAYYKATNKALDQRVVLQLPRKDDTFKQSYMDKKNTNAVYNKFVTYLETENLIK